MSDTDTDAAAIGSSEHPPEFKARIKSKPPIEIVALGEALEGLWV
jgi:hypothetical protein